MKKNKYFSSIQVLLCLLLSSSLFAQNQSYTANPWEDISENTFAPRSHTERQIIPKAYRTVQLDWTVLQMLLLETPMRFSIEAAQREIILSLPLPDGTSQQFKIVNAPVLHKNLAQKYPNIQAFAGQGIDDPTAYLRFDITPQGFHAMVLRAKGSSIFIDPYAKGDIDHYISYYKKDFVKKNKDRVCLLTGSEIEESSIENVDDEEVRRMLTGDCQLRKYRLALACTGEYAQFHGGTTAGALAAMNTSMTRVNGVFERDAGITMEIVETNEDIIFLDAISDPYSNGNGGAMLDQNQTTIDNIVGSANYDIGHVFSTGGGGVASLNSPCSVNRKAQGVTGQGSPVGDPFDIDFVAHEMGHQYGGNHTQNNNCARTSVSVEPGSASTIMGYAGICSPNIQNNSDDYFHIINLREIAQNVLFGTSSSCPTIMDTGNNQPTADAGNDYSIPISTPFVLTGAGEDIDGNQSLSYTWEQMDAQAAPMPPQATNTSGPAFRSMAPSISASRYFPNLNAIINNATPTWEVLPNNSRVMNFTFTVRDNNMGNGCTDEDDVRVNTTASAGPFLVVEPNTNVTWWVGSSREVLWDVANTTAAPVSCSQVDILLSTDGGQTYPITLAESIPNNGATTVNVPDAISSDCRLRINCSDNIFFDISDTDFVIEAPPFPSFSIEAEPSSMAICTTVDEVVYTLNLTSIAGFDEAVSLSVNGLPEGATSSFEPNGLQPSGEVTFTIGNLTTVSAGIYNIMIEAVSETTAKTLDLELQISTNVPNAVSLLSPENGTDGLSLFPLLSWEELEGVTHYQLEIANNPAFGVSTIETAMVDVSNYLLENLEEGQVYYWRVRAVNECGEGANSAIFAFQTGISSCQIFESSDVPIPISTSIQTLTSTLSIEEDRTISDLNLVNLDIAHTWVGDLSATLQSPNGTVVTLFDRAGVPSTSFGCGNANILVGFDDEAMLSADAFENSCSTASPAIGGTFQGLDALAAFQRESSRGDWVLTLVDNAAEDGGQLLNWGIEVCFEVAATIAPSVLHQTLILIQGDNATISHEFLSASSENSSPQQMIFIITQMPQYGILQLNGITLELGDTFSQEDIDNGLLVYVHNGENVNLDGFMFNVLSNSNGWSSGNVFNISILTRGFSLLVNLDNPISCNGENDGAISASPNGGTAPFMYSIDGENFQESNIFEGLSAGTYSITGIDADGLSVTSPMFSISEPDALMLVLATDENTITATASGGTGNYQYSIDGQNFQDENSFTTLDNGLYTVIVKDENGCISSESATIAVNTLVADASIEQAILCFGDNNAIISVLASGGTPPYQYSIDGENFQMTNLFEGLGSGLYVFTVLDSEGFTHQTATIEVLPVEPIVVEAVLTGNALVINASGGTGLLEYSIDDGQNFTTDNSFSDLENGEYEIIVRDENDCREELSVIINTITTIELSILPSTCSDGNASVTIAEVVGGTPPYQYSLDGGDFQTDPSFTNLFAGEHTIAVRDANNNQFELIFSIALPVSLEITVETLENDLSIGVSGGTPPYQYSIDGGITFETTSDFMDLPNGTYEIVVMDANACQQSATAVINISSLNDLKINLFFKVQPNPTLGLFSIILNQPTQKSLDISIFDALGKEVYGERSSKTSSYFQHLIDINHLATGVYFLKVTDGILVGNQQIIIIE